MTFQQMAGDVILIKVKDSDKGWISPLIRKMTDSPYSHSMLALDAETLVDADQLRPQRSKVIKRWHDTSAATFKRTEPRVEYLTVWRPKPAPDRAMMITKLNFFRGQHVEFSISDTIGLAALRLVQRAITSERVSSKPPLKAAMDRLVNALILSVGDGYSHLFCSEFVYRELVAGGCTPELPQRPSVDPGNLSTESPPDALWNPFLDSVEEFISKSLGLQKDTLRQFTTLWSTVEDHYRAGTVPTRFDVANFWTPADFAHSGSMDRVATLR